MVLVWERNVYNKEIRICPDPDYLPRYYNGERIKIFYFVWKGFHVDVIAFYMLSGLGSTLQYC